MSIMIINRIVCQLFIILHLLIDLFILIAGLDMRIQVNTF